MKKAISLFFVFIALMLSSCASWSIDEVSAPVGDTEALVNGIEYVSAVDFGKEYSAFSQRTVQPKLIPAAGMLLFEMKVAGNLIAYDPLHDRASYFCFDPACTHPLEGGCVAKTLKISRPYTYYDGYFYFAYTPAIVDQNSEGGIARVSVDGSEMEVIYKMNCWNVTHLKAGGGYLYIQYMGQDGIDRYDLKTGEYITFNSEEHYNGFIVTEEGVILHSRPYVYFADHDLKNKTSLFGISAIVYAGEKIYHLDIEYAEDGKTATTIHFYEYDMKTGEDRYLYTEKGGMGGMHCADENYLYFSPRAGKTAQFITGGIIKRIDVATGECETVFDDPRLDIEELYSIDGKLYAAMRNAGGYKSWLPGMLNEKGTIYGKLVDEDNDGMYEFVPFEWDGSELSYDKY